MTDRNEWRDVPGYDGLYQVSQDGDVRSWRGWRGRRTKEPQTLKPFTRKGRSGRKTFVNMTTPDGRRHHVAIVAIVADTWMGGTPPGHDRVHINGMCSDNRVANIKFVPHAEAARAGAGANRRPVVKLNRDGEAVAFYSSIKAAAEANYISPKAIRERCNNITQDPYSLDGHNYQFDK